MGSGARQKQRMIDARLCARICRARKILRMRLSGLICTPLFLQPWMCGGSCLDPRGPAWPGEVPVR